MKPVVSNVFYAPLVKRHVVAVIVPVLREGDLVYILSIGIPTDKFLQFLAAPAGSEGRVAAVLDRDRVFVARSEKHSEHTGKSIRRPDKLSEEGVRVTTNLDGTPFHWSIAAPMQPAGPSPSACRERRQCPARARPCAYLAAGAVLLAGAIALAFGFGSWMTRWSGRLGIDRQPTRDEFRVLFRVLPNSVLLVDSAGVILLVNALIETYFGYARGELVGQPVELLLPHRFRIGHRQLRDGFAAAPEIRQMGAGRDLYGRRKDGSEFPVELGLNPINTSAGRLVMATVVDISARKQAAERLLAAAKALKASEDQCRLAIDAAELGVWTWDMAKDEVWWSDRLRQVLAVPADMPTDHANYFDGSIPRIVTFWTRTSGFARPASATTTSRPGDRPE